MHDHGHSLSLFNRLDAQTGSTATFHLNLQAAKSDFDVPNTYDQNDAGQAQHQSIDTFNVAPGLFAGDRLEDAVHRECVRPAGSSHLHAESRSLRRSAGERVAGPDADATSASRPTSAYTTGIHNVKARRRRSVRPSSTRTSRSASPIPISTHRRVADYNPALAPYDLTRGGSPLVYAQAATIKQQAAYVQDDIKAGNATVKLGVRLDHYDGLSTATLVQPRLGVSYAVPSRPTRCCAPRTAGRWKRRTTRTCCSRAASA